MKVTVELPWPSSKLHPNARLGHWGQRKRAAKKAREDAHVLTIHAQSRTKDESGRIKLFIHDQITRIPVALTFHPPDRRHRDEDGMVASCKSFLDGVADALMVNDKLFKLGAPRVLEPVKGGKVIVEIG